MTGLRAGRASTAVPDRRSVPLVVMHLTTVDMSLALLVRPQLQAVVDRGGVAVGVSAPGPFVPGLEATGIRHVALVSSTRQRNVLADLRAAREFWRVLRQVRPSVLHTHNPKPGVYGRILGRLAGVPVVVNTVHGLYATDDDPLTKRMLVGAIEAFCSRWSHAELVQNPEDVEYLRRWRLAPRRRLHLLGNGVDLARFALSDDERARARARVRQEWGVSPDEVVVGTVGRLVAEKGYPELFEAVRGLPGARLVVVGGADPAKPDALAPDVVERAVADGVVFAGFRDDMPDVYAGFDAFVLASHREGFPRAAMEAAASGLAIVATDIRGCRQVVDPGRTGTLVPVRDASALRGALAELVTSPGRRAQYGREGRQRALEYFDERAVVDRVLACYSEVADRRGLRLDPDPQD